MTFREIDTSKELNDVEMFKMVMRNRATSLGISVEDLANNPEHMKVVLEVIRLIKRKYKDNITASSLWTLMGS